MARAARAARFPVEPGPLDADLRRVLDAERRWASEASEARGAKAEWIRRQLGMTPLRYQQLLQRALDHPDAARYAPGVVHRLLRLRHDRRGRGAGEPRSGPR